MNDMNAEYLASIMAWKAHDADDAQDLKRLTAEHVGNPDLEDSPQMHEAWRLVQERAWATQRHIDGLEWEIEPGADYWSGRIPLPSEQHERMLRAFVEMVDELGEIGWAIADAQIVMSAAERRGLVRWDRIGDRGYGYTTQPLTPPACMTCGDIGEIVEMDDGRKLWAIWPHDDPLMEGVDRGLVRCPACRSDHGE